MLSTIQKIRFVLTAAALELLSCRQEKKKSPAGSSRCCFAPIKSKASFIQGAALSIDGGYTIT
ncbi:uncharacterized protein FFB20_04487 [Fusarium fujikuroi]|nr:uncharacterized protein FFB20_04487 [Fusarium fujikuroi]SCN91228.1 uncharacterized protein FFC1_06326 [Fusarium fujikuroi]SCO01941.1 uncharacterized protein FFE2_09892 [Fusarium fujikuroi]SCO37827.1 uncharacterized protein FFNC_05885 [Fusarium fujikuroi]SCV34063.1 uncharacterized protein FFFS_04175 [Fusarium fujikuroi]